MTLRCMSLKETASSRSHTLLYKDGSDSHSLRISHVPPDLITCISPVRLHPPLNGHLHLPLDSLERHLDLIIRGPWSHYDEYTLDYII